MLSGLEYSARPQIYPLVLGLWLASQFTPYVTIWQGPRNVNDRAKQGTLKLPIMKMTGNLE